MTGPASPELARLSAAQERAFLTQADYRLLTSAWGSKSGSGPGCCSGSDGECESGEFDLAGLKFTRDEGFRVIKKALIYLLMVLDNANNFVRLKTGGRLGRDSRIDPYVSRVNRERIRECIRKGDCKSVYYRPDLGLAGMSIQDLLSRIHVDDLILYVKLSRLNFLDVTSATTAKKRLCPRHVWIRAKRMAKRARSADLEKACTNWENGPAIDSDCKLPKTESDLGAPLSPEEHSAQWVKVEVHKFEVDDILLAKQKRQDQLLKHSYRVLRKALQSRARCGSKSKHDCLPPNITKRMVADQKKCKSFADPVKQYAELGLLRQELLQNVLHKHEKIMDRSLSLQSFMRELMSKQKKQGWLLQDILNSMHVLAHCREETIQRKSARRGGGSDKRATHGCGTRPKSKRIHSRIKRVKTSTG